MWCVYASDNDGATGCELATLLNELPVDTDEFMEAVNIDDLCETYGVMTGVEICDEVCDAT